MTTFSANLGFLWSELALPDAIRAAKKAGFDAVECHFPYNENPAEVVAALNETSMEMLGLNTTPGNRDAGENGFAALPGREADARAAIDQAIDYAVSIKARNVHVMAGFASGEDAHQQFIDNLKYATAKVADTAVTILIEPLNRYDAPDYFLSTTLQAEKIIREVDSPKLKLMFDCYHVQVMQGNVTRLFDHHFDDIGHVQFASAPDRGAPGTGEQNFSYLFDYFDKRGYTDPLGAEYKPNGDTEASLGWMGGAA